MDDLFSLPISDGVADRDIALTRLIAHLQAGNLVGAMLVVKGMDAKSVRQLMLKAGFDVVPFRQDDFWLQVQRELIQAARARVDGWGLKALLSENK